METDLHPDATIIDGLGGPTTVAELMGIRDVRGAVQRVSNWKRRGIPPSVRLEFPSLFPVDGAFGDRKKGAAGSLASSLRGNDDGEGGYA